MTLRELKSAIRNMPGNPKIRFHAGNLVPLCVAVQKGSLLEALDGAFSGGRSTETNLYIREDGFISRVGDT